MRNAALLLLLAVNADRTMILAWELLESARYGADSREHGAFLVTDESGQLQLSRWPSGAESLRATYRGEIPRRALAIIHTHPNGRPNPSADDVATVQKLGMAVYVVTRTSVTRTDGRQTTRVAYGDWNPHR